MENIDYFKSIPTVVLKDPLAKTLGVGEGVFEYSFEDAVKMAGHACPTLAFAYLGVFHGLKALYGSEVPVRGEIRVDFKEGKGEGVTGVVASVYSLITGAKEEDGFKGLNGKFPRNNLLFFSQDTPMYLRMSNNKTQEYVDIANNIPNLSLPALDLTLLKSDSKTFGALWQKRVEEIFAKHFDAAVVVKKV